MKKISIVVFNNGKFLSVKDKLWENGMDYWTVPCGVFDSFIEDSEKVGLEILKEKTGLDGKIIKTLCKNNFWQMEEIVLQAEITGGNLKENAVWKYLMEFSEIERNWLFSKGLIGAIEEWRFDKIRVLEEYREKNKSIIPGQIVFAGSSLQENFPIERFVSESYGNKITVYNRGIGGYTTREMLCILDDVIINLKPSVLFLNIGTNDLADSNITLETVISNYEKIVKIALEKISGLKVFVMAYYPGNLKVAKDYMIDVLKIRTNEKIERANIMLKRLSMKLGLNFIDLNDAVSDLDGNLLPEFSVEGMHINEKGYKSIFILLKPILEKVAKEISLKTEL